MNECIGQGVEGGVHERLGWRVHHSASECSDAELGVIFDATNDLTMFFYAHAKPVHSNSDNRQDALQDSQTHIHSSSRSSSQSLVV